MKLFICTAIAAVCGLIPVQGYSQTPVVTRFDSSGNLSWTNAVSNGVYWVEWASSVQEQWRTDSPFGPMVAMGESISVKVPMFYRVIFITPLLTNQLVGYYPFTGNAHDESGHGHDGLVAGASPALDRFGNTNSAYWFDGNDYIDCPDSPGDEYDFETNQNFTISCWIRTETLPSWYPSIVTKGTANREASYSMYLNNTGMAVFDLWRDNSQYSVTTPSNVINNTWHQLVGIRRDGYIELYLDGSIVASNICTMASIIVTADLRIGKHPADSGVIGR